MISVTQVRSRGEDGFTLIEAMISVIIMAIIIGPLTAAMILGFDNTTKTAARLDQSGDRNLAQIYLPRDVLNTTTSVGNGPLVGGLPTTIPLTSSNVCAAQAGQPASASPGAGVPALVNPAAVLVLRWNAQVVKSSGQPVSFTSTPYEVDYVMATNPQHPVDQPTTSQNWLWRLAYTGWATTGTCIPIAGSAYTTLVYGLKSSSTAAVGTPASSTPGTPVPVSLALTDASGKQYTISAQERT